MMTTASELADYLARQMPIHGSISRSHAERLLFMRYGYLTAQQVIQAVLVAYDRGQITREHGGVTLRRGK